ncbi:hypothetical protein GO755_04535 [Spirosoma sp. HMF4905]|uniref:Uncharacterized protein n=1 Tax=Spirosoma arboris TaxID=2682092 RepID=A0A7K1S648_9BACT|nr:hypothetical protein [Spirosoma arboris]MVM29289.1 hypothetical protein [Spirosoma arboris]
MAQETEQLLFEVVLDIPKVKENAEIARAALASLRVEKEKTQQLFTSKLLGEDVYRKTMQALQVEIDKTEKELAGYTKALAAHEKQQKQAEAIVKQMSLSMAVLEANLDSLNQTESKSGKAAQQLAGELEKANAELNRQEAISQAATGSMDELDKLIAELTDEYHQFTQAQRDDATVGGVRLKQINDLTRVQQKNQKVMDESRKSIKEYLRDINVLGFNVGSTLDSFKSGAQGVGLFTKAVFTGRGALIALGAVPIVLLLTGLVTILTKTQAGMDFVAKATGAVGAVFDVLIKSGIELTKAFIELFTSPTAAITHFHNIIRGLPSAVAQAAQAGVAIVELNQRIREEERALRLERAQGRAEIAAQKKLAEDVTQTQTVREAAARKAYALENSLLQKQISLQQQRIASAKAEYELSQKTAADKDKVAEEQIKLADIEAESKEKQIELQNKLNQIQIEGEQKRINLLIANSQKELEIAQRNGLDVLHIQKKLLDEQLQLSLVGVAKGTAEEKAIRVKYETDLLALNTNAAFDLQEKQNSITSAGIRQRLLLVEKGTAEEFELRRQLIDQETEEQELALSKQLGKTTEYYAKLRELEVKRAADKREIDKQEAQAQLSTIQHRTNTALAKTKAGSKAELDERLNQIREAAAQELLQVQDNADAQEEIWANMNRAIADARKDFNQKLINNSLDALATLTDALSNVSQAITQRDNKLLEEQQTAQLKSAGLSAEARTQIEEKYAQKKDELDRKSAERARKLATIQNIIATAQAVTAAQILPPPFDAIKTVLALAVGAAQQAVIASQQFEHGGEIVEGPSHAQGGVKYSVRGRRQVELEGGEGIVNKRSMAIPGVKQKISEFNQLGGGIAYPGTMRINTGAPLASYMPSRLALGGILTPTYLATTSPGAPLDYERLGSVVAGMVLQTVKSLPPQYVRVGDIRNGVDRQVRVENKANIKG